MAFNTNVAQLDQSQSNKKTEAYINFYLPVRRQGEVKQAKLSFAALGNDKDIDKHLLELFRSNPEEAAERLRNALIIQFNEATNSGDTELML